MNVRGICCLRPGVPGLTDRIRVFSIVGRYLEHPRIFAFGRGEKARIYIGSADFMTRNTERRVEIACPILDEDVRRQLFHYIQVLCADNRKARLLQADGSYVSVPREEHAPEVDAQQVMMEEAVQQARQAQAQPACAPARRSGGLSGLLERLRRRAGGD